MTDYLRRQWILNDTRIYSLYRISGKPLDIFVRENRPAIDRLIQVCQWTLRESLREPMRISA